ncbi:hypothetical protein LCGC14_1842440 [marine sediment metagenome]|uniref:Transcription regulator TrmB N-terminal domain-containing protein n=1 Tax=marine sediment metagenome TaxID=412755 RepID=A0A0F9H108_9ZZZZ
MAEIIQILDQDVALFSKGKDIFKLKIMKYIVSKDQYECFYMSDLIKKFKGKSRSKIYKVLRELEDQGIIKKIKSYPVFWKRNYE